MNRFKLYLNVLGQIMVLYLVPIIISTGFVFYETSSQ